MGAYTAVRLGKYVSELLRFEFVGINLGMQVRNNKGGGGREKVGDVPRSRPFTVCAWAGVPD